VILAAPDAKPPITPVGVALSVSDREATCLPTGGVVLSNYGAPPLGGVQRVLTAIPGANVLRVYCGPITDILGPTQRISVPDWEGPFSLAWAILAGMKKDHSNVVLISGLESLLGRKRFAIGLTHLVRTLRGCGALVCVHPFAR
jgi:hypothetical protein